MPNPIKIACSIICAAILIAVAISVRRPDRWPAHAPADTCSTLQTQDASFANPAQTAPEFDYHSVVLNLLAPFETATEDPLLREKRGDAFQAAIEQFSAAEVSRALKAIDEVHAANPSEAATDLRDRLLQRSRVNIAEVPPSVQPDSPVADLITLSDHDPITAAQSIIEQLEPGPEQSNLLVGVVQRLALQDHEAALAWVQQFPEGELRERALIEIDRIVFTSVKAQAN